VSAPTNAPLAFTLEGSRPNPAMGHELSVRFTLPVAGDARLELVDVAGRSVRAREVGSLGAGQHVVSLAEGPRIRPGLYFLLLTQGPNRKAVRVTVLG
jgi:hypothetical protein